MMQKSNNKCIELILKNLLLNSNNLMYYFIFLGTTFIILISISISAQTRSVWTPDNGNGTYTNPLMWGDWPDPDVIRVGDMFYFISTSMHYVPGCPIAESKDLVNWKMAGYAILRYTEDPRYDMRGGAMYLNGSWAATIRYHKGIFYVGFCTPHGISTKSGHFSMCTAKNIKGPWKRTIFPQYLYDPGLLFDDDGKVYVVHGQGTLYVTELAKDALSVKKIGVKIWDRTFNASGEVTNNGLFGLEGSHFYKINGKYYILNAGGGTQGFQICLRSKNVYGPYEWKCICHDDSSYPPNGLHQGGMVQLKNGKWWFIIMQDRGAVGRVPNLEPVTWIDGWPMLGKNGNGKGVVTYKKPKIRGYQPITVPATSDEFNFPILGLQWQWNHNPDDNKYSLKDHPGYLRLRASLATDIKNARNTLTQRVQGPACEGSVEVNIKGLKDGDIAGFGIFQFPYAFIGVQQKKNARTIVMINDGETIASFDNITQNNVWFKAIVDSSFVVSFFYSLNDSNFQSIGNKLQMGLGLTWTGNRFALFNYTTKVAGIDGYADFNWFHFKME
jgi:beta-xylosidase